MSEDVKPEVIKKTQDLLGKYFKKPPLTEKLLRKPPFRFIQDIILAINEETKFFEGLFTKEELNMDITKDKKAKLAYLTKVIEVVKLITGIELTVRATKIISGQEPTKTNELLQAIGRALDKKINSKEAIIHYKNRNEQKADAKKHLSKEYSSKKSVSETLARSTKAVKKEQRKTEPDKRKAEKIKSQEQESKEKLNEGQISKHPDFKYENSTETRRKKLSHHVLEAHTETDVVNVSADSKIKKTSDSVNGRVSAGEKPRTPQPKNVIPKGDEPEDETKIDENNEDSIKQTEHTNRSGYGKYAESLKHDNESMTNVKNSMSRENIVLEKLRDSNSMDLGNNSASVGNSCASVANIIVEKSERKDEVEDDMVTIETNKGPLFESATRKEINVTDEHGYLVAQILKTEQELVTINNTDTPNRRVEIVWQTGIIRDRESVLKTVSSLRKFMQTLITFTNPLGKILDYVQGDIEIMQRELIDYRNQYAAVNILLEDERKKTDKFMHLMEESLEDIEAKVYDELNKVYQVKINISKNEYQIQRLLNDCV